MKNLFQNILSGGLMALFMIAIVACGGNQDDNSDANGAEQSRPQITQSDTTNQAANAKLNINTASGEAFRTIPEVGDRMVHEFEEYRPYVSIQQFRKEIGKYVDEDRVASYEEYIFVPVHRNDSDAATLMQIPGLDEGEAEEIINGRPYENNRAFFDALTSLVNDEELATAQKYIKSE